LKESFSREELGSLAPQGWNQGEDDPPPHADLIFPRPWNPMEGKDLGSRVWGESGGGRELGLGRSTVLVREGSGWEREKSEI